METVTADPAIGSVEYYTEMLANYADPADAKWLSQLALGLVDSALNFSAKYGVQPTEVERVEHARNVLAAFAQIKSAQATAR